MSSFRNIPHLAIRLKEGVKEPSFLNAENFLLQRLKTRKICQQFEQSCGIYCVISCAGSGYVCVYV